MSLIRFLRAVLILGNLSRVINRVEQIHCPREVPISSTSADRSEGPYPASLPQQQLKQWRKVKHLLATSYISLLVTYHLHVISTFNTCSWGPTHRSLTDTGQGYNLGGLGYPHHTPRASQLMVLRFPPKGSIRSQVNHLIIDN
jgi:hypothetical protein